ncbi:anti-sigma factor domain-containing protein [Actinoplanes sp. CA-030573]|uniref:anti-sigma factor n=1 Tax=Actinoplanes sp. CA-030573 TaxID=3239898 RepID=UPI003D8F162D
MVIANVHSLVGAYALDAVDDLERIAFERHLRECEDCGNEIAELREVAARLADGAWSSPPPRLRESVMTAVADTRQPPPAEPPAPPAGARPPRRMRLVAAAALVAAAGTCTCTCTCTAVYAVQDQRIGHQRQLAEAARASESRVHAVLAAPDLVVREQRLATGGHVKEASSRLTDAGVIMLAATGAPPAGRVYQLWTIRAGTPSPAGTLAAGQSAIVQIVDGLPGASGVGVTVEPAPRSPTRTLPLDAKVTMT